VALDRLIELQLEGECQGIPVDEFKKHREAIRHDIEARGWNGALESYSQVLDGDTLDSTLLLLAFHGFDEASSPRMQRTYERILERLAAGPGLLYRNEQNSGGREGAFALCSFWVAEFLARGGGSIEQARSQFDQTLTYANDIGLFAEQIDPSSGEALGNFPQAFTHMGLINAALSLAEREGSEANSAERIIGSSEISLVFGQSPSFASEVRP
jgi:GH15 family glucan-1,4-alpha-glucosidase